ncbi:MAG: hypothetical protein ACK5O2_01655 [Microthrixaceae bacterium]
MVVLLIALLVAIGAFVAVRAFMGGAAITGTVDECRIDADGTLTASGTVRSDEALDRALSIRFEDAQTGAEVDRATVDVAGGPEETIPWTVRGQAGDSVNRVDCILGPMD